MEILEQQEVVQSKTEAREEVISKIERGEITLSFSAIKEFAKSPSHFINYKLGDKKQTAAMKQGSLIHCAILEPNELENRYCILEQKDLPNPESDFRNTENKKFKALFEEKAKAQNKEIISPAEWQNAIERRDLAYNNEVVSPYLKSLRNVEVGVFWEFGGYNWRGFIDGIGPAFCLDLKTVDSAVPDKVIRKAINERFHWQQFLYKQSKEVPNYFSNFNLLIDSDNGMTLMKVEWTALAKAESELLKILEQFKICTENRLWNQNYEFWANNSGGYYSFE